MFLQRFTFRSFRFLDPLVFISFQGAAAAAAGRGSPPPPWAGVESGQVETVSMLCFLVKYSINGTEEAGGRSTPDPQPPGKGPLLRDMSTKMEGPGVCEKMHTARWFFDLF